MTEASRRAVLAGACGVGVAAVLAGCSTYDSSKKQESKPATKPAAGPLAKTSDIPVGGGKIFTKQAVVVTQPTTGQFKCFTAICTHQGCTVDQVKDGTIDCPCHGSKYHIADGTVANGPAVKGLASKNITVTGDQITLA